MTTAKLILDGKEYEFPTIVGTEGEVGIDIAKLRGATGAITFDPGYGNTGSCKSTITFIDGEKGILHYRGYLIEDLADAVSFEEAAYLLIWGALPNAEQLAGFKAKLDAAAELPKGVLDLIATFPRDAHPMGILQAATSALSAYCASIPESDEEAHITGLIAKYKTLCAAIYRHGKSQAPVAPKAGLSYAADFVRMMHGADYVVPAEVEEALDKLLILHADHEQNCSTSTVRMVGSSRANLYASIGAGVGALWGPLHGGANQEVLEMLEEVHKAGGDTARFVSMAKDKDSGFKLMGFGHRVYKNHDPRAKVIKVDCDRVLAGLGVEDPLLEIAKKLEAAALSDEYFVQRKLFPNVDFYSGIIYRALGIPTEMFTVMFALGRLPGWISQWKELRDEGARINRPRQIYTGATQRPVPAIDAR
jgi:citrate synthase